MPFDPLRERIEKKASARRRVCALPMLLLILSLACSLPTPAGKPAATATLTQEAERLPVPTLQPSPTATPQPLPPALVESDPAPGGEMPLRGPIRLYFNQPMDRASVEAALEGPVGQVDWQDDAALSFLPVEPLRPDSTVRLKIAETARAANGLALTAPLDLTFNTPGYLRLAQRLPEPGAGEINPSSAVVAAFNQPVVPLGADPAGLPVGFQLEPAAPGRGEWLNTSTYIFYPQPALAGGVTYTVHLEPGLHSLAGAPLDSADLAEATGWSFSTAMPRLVKVEPVAEKDLLRLDAEFVLTFNQPMDQASLAQHLQLLDQLGAPIAGRLTWNENSSRATFVPGNLLRRDQVYTLALDGQAKALGGTALGTAQSWQFRTFPTLQVLGADPLPGAAKSVYGGVTLVFNAPIQAKDVVEFLTFTPRVPELFAFTEDGDQVLHLFGQFAPQVEYNLLVSPNLPDAWNGRLGQEFSLTFQTLPLEPNLVIQGGGVLFVAPQEASLRAQATNLPRLGLSLGTLPLADFFAMQAQDGYTFEQTYQPADAVTFEQTLETPPNRSQAVDLRLTPDGAPLQPGLYFLRLQLDPEQIFTGPFLLVVSDIQLTFKVSATDALVWAVDLQSGQPVSGAPVTIYGEGGSQLAQGTTDSNGLMRAALAPQTELYTSRFAMLGAPGQENFALALSTWNRGLEEWTFGLQSDYSPPHPQVYLYTDRPIYQPGQTVYFRAVARQAYNGRYAPLESSNLALELIDDQGTLLTTYDLPLSAFGTASGAYPLPETTQPGYYRLATPEAPADGVFFQVAEYRKPEIELHILPEALEVQAGQNLVATVNARYYFDAPAGNVTLQWAVYKQSDFFDLPGYQVGPADESWLEPFFFGRGFGGLGELVQQGQAVTDPQGTWQLQLPTLLEKSRQRYTIEVTAADESGLPVSGRASLAVNPAEFYIGLRPESWIGRAGEASGFEVRVVTPEKQPAGSRQLRAEFSQVSWRQEAQPGQLPVFVPKYNLVGSTDFVTSLDSLARLVFIPPEPGTYQLAVFDLTGSGGVGRALTQLTLWVGGPGQAIWPNLAGQRLQLTADQPAYRPGQTARIFIPNPFAGAAQALLTVERGVVLRSEVLAVEGAGREFELPLSADDAPNVYVAVTLLQGAASGRPDFRQGYLNLPVQPQEQVLNVALSSKPARAGPGEPVQLELRVTDSAGNPVEAEFTLAVVDRAVLALAEPNSQEIVTAFYDQQPLGVRTGLALAAYTRLNAFAPEGRGGGGGGEPGAPPAVRTRFLDTALWEAALVTGPDGTAQVELRLPDNLTTWQVDVRGLTTDTHVGQAQTQLVATKDLLLRPLAPHFLVVGDRVQLAAVAQNNTTETLAVEVALQATGLALDASTPARQQVSLPAGGRARLEWWAAVEAVTEVDLLYSAAGQAASGQAYQDAISLSLPVLRYTRPQTFGTSGILATGGAVQELVSLPRGVDISNTGPAAGGLEVQLAPSLAAAMLAGLEALEDFPFDCTEPLLSRFLPNLETYRVLNSFGLEAPGLQARLQSLLETGLARLLAWQNPDGGWYWCAAPARASGESGNRAQAVGSDPYITAYVLFGLSRAQQAGVSVPTVAVVQAVNFLRATLPAPGMLVEPWQLERLALTQFALAQAGAGDLGGAAALYEQRTQLGSWAQALLALTIENLSPGDERAATLLADLQTEALRSATGAHWESSADADGSRRNMSGPVHATAVVLLALAQQDPAAPLVAEAVRYLMAHRRATGGWDSSFASAWTLLALAQVLQGTGELSADFDFSARLNGTLLAQGQSGGDTRLRPVTAQVALSDLRAAMPNDLIIQREAGPGRLYYSAHLAVSLPVDQAQSLSQGLSLSRAYYASSRVEAGPGELLEPAQAIQQGRAGQLITVRLTLVAPETLYYLMLEDYLPAGAEVLDTRLKTSQQGAAVEGVVRCDGLEEGRCYDPLAPFTGGWGWWYFAGPQVYADHVAWRAEGLPPGTYELTYTLVLLQAGQFQALPARAWQFYFPEVQATSPGAVFTVEP